jgi:protein gp37
VWTGEVRINWEWIEQPLQWTRARKIFVAAHGDLFHDGLADSEIATIFGVMVAAHHLHGHILQVLTKRARRMRELLNSPEFWEQVNAETEAHVMERVDTSLGVATMRARRSAIMAPTIRRQEYGSG